MSCSYSFSRTDTPSSKMPHNGIDWNSLCNRFVDLGDSKVLVCFPNHFTWPLEYVEVIHNISYFCHPNCISYHHNLISYSQIVNAFILCWLKQLCLLARCIDNVSTDTLTIYSKKDCGALADNYSFWLLFQMSKLSGIPVEDLELCKVKISRKRNSLLL